MKAEDWPLVFKKGVKEFTQHHPVIHSGRVILDPWSCKRVKETQSCTPTETWIHLSRFLKLQGFYRIWFRPWSSLAVTHKQIHLLLMLMCILRLIKFDSGCISRFKFSLFPSSVYLEQWWNFPLFSLKKTVKGEIRWFNCIFTFSTLQYGCLSVCKHVLEYMFNELFL